MLTAAGLVEFRIFLGGPFHPALETVLPKFLKPGVSVIGFWLKLQVIVIKPLHIRRLELDRYSANSFPLVAVCHIVPVRPAIAEEINKGRKLSVRRLLL